MFVEFDKTCEVHIEIHVIFTIMVKDFKFREKLGFHVTRTNKV